MVFVIPLVFSLVLDFNQWSVVIIRERNGNEVHTFENHLTILAISKTVKYSTSTSYFSCLKDCGWKSYELYSHFAYSIPPRVEVALNMPLWLLTSEPFTHNFGDDVPESVTVRITALHCYVVSKFSTILMMTFNIDVINILHNLYS